VTIVSTRPDHMRGERFALASLSAAGIAMLIFVALGPFLIRTAGYAVFIPALAASGLLTLVAAKLAGDVPARTGLIIILGLALAMRLLLVGQEPFLSTDIYRYIWDGRVQGVGINPYIYVPADPALAALRDSAIFPHINRADYAVTGYPPVAQMFYVAVTRISESLAVMRLAMIGCEVVIVAIVIDLARTLARPVTAVVAYAWHPLAIWEVASSGHVDALMVALLMLGIWLLVRARPVAGAAVVALATLVKPYAVFALPAFWRPWDWRAPVAAIAVVILCYLPYASAGRGVLGFATAYPSEEDMLGGSGLWLVALVRLVVDQSAILVPIYFALAACVMGWLALRVSFRAERTPQTTIDDIALLLTAGIFLFSPNYAWYMLALVPFLALGAGAPIWALTLAAFFLYRPALLPENDLAWKTIATVPFLIAVAVTFVARSRTLHSRGERAWTS
jgi:alpha-1,6-mannosyltransferase